MSYEHKTKKKLIDELTTLQKRVASLEKVKDDYQKTAEKHLDSQQALFTLMSNLPGVVYRCLNDKYWTMKFFSDGCIELTGYKPNELTNNKKISYEEIIHPEDRGSVREIVNSAVTEKTRYHITYRIITKEGDVKWVWEQGRAVHSSKGDLRYLEGIIIDITKRQQTYEKLQRSEEKYKTIIENNGVAICIVNENDLISTINTEFENLVSYKKDEVEGKKTWRDFIYKDDLEKMEEYRRLRLSDPKLPPKKYEFRMIDRNGNIKDIYATFGLIPNTKIAVASLLDITERKQMVEKLRKSEERFRVIFKSSAIGIARVDLDGRLIESNPAFQNMLGYSGKELSEMVFADFTHPDDVETDLKLFKELISGKRKEYNIEKRYIRKDKKIIWGHLTGSLVQAEDGKPLFGIGMVEDITERRQAEEALDKEHILLRTLIDELPDLIYVKDNKSRFTVANRRIAQFMGAETPGDLIGKTDFDYYSKDIAQIFFSTEQNIIQTGKPYIQKDEPIPFPSGITRQVLTTKIPLRDTSGKIIGIIGMGHDLTEYKELENQLLQSQKMDAIGRLTGGIAHDFNNVLTAIMGYTEFLQMKLKKDKTLLSYVKEIRKAGERAVSLTRQLLAFSRKQILQPMVININSIVTDMEKMLKRLIGEDIDLVAKLDPKLGNIKADPSQIDQIIMNIAINAKDAMPQGGKLTIETENVYLDRKYASIHVSAKPGAYVMLAISDNGVGMDKETKDQIFEPFFTTKKEGKGTGLGLSTVYGIVKQSGGNIWVYSEPKKGTTFKIYLPRVFSKIQQEQLSIGKVKKTTGTETIFIVEDEEQVREMISYGLKNFGYEVVQSKSGEDALDVIEKQEFHIYDLLITDIVLPGLNGRELAEKVNQINEDTKVLYISGYADDAIVHHGILEEGINFLPKPFTLHDLGRKVREILDSD